MISLEWLKRTELFNGLMDSQLEVLLSRSILKSYSEGATLFLQGEEANYLFILIKGLIELTIKTKEQTQFVASKIEKEGAVFGTASLMEPFQYNVSATCLKPSEVLMINAKWLRERMMEDPMMGLEIMKKLAALYFSRLNTLRAGISNFIKEFKGKSL